jgi:ketosteroid isomerase-like protein
MARTILFVAVLLFGTTSAPSGMQSVAADLEDAYDHLIERLNAKDLDGFLDCWHPEAILFVRDYYFAIDRKEAGPQVWTQIFEEFFDSPQKATFTPIDTSTRIFGDEGIVWGFTQLLLQNPDGQSTRETSRTTVIFKKTAGDWKVICWHNSAPPGG